MALTPTEVEGKTFGTALRGYDLDEVDDFLDEVVSTLRDLQDQLAKARATQAEPAAPPVVADESAVGRALIAAQAAGDTIVSDAREESERTVNDAREESERILTDARGEAETWATERDAKKADADVEMAELTEHVSNVRTQLALLATTVADRLDEMDLAIGGEADSTATGEVAEEEVEVDDNSDDDADVESFNLDDEEMSGLMGDAENGGDEDEESAKDEDE